MEEWVFEFVGGAPCLDFANTVSGDRRVAPKERIHGYGDLVSWARQAELLTPAQSRALLLRAQRDPAAASQAHAEALALRDSIFEIFFALSEGKRPAPAHLDRLNRALAEALAHRRVVQSGRNFALGWEDADDLRRILWPVALSAAELLAHADHAPVKLCGLWDTTGCSWLFVDESRNHSRRWCSMKDCGNVAKARRHYARTKHQ